MKIPNQPIDKGYIDLDQIIEKRKILTLRDYQQKNLGYLLNNKRAGDLSEAGTGKTPTACLWNYAQIQNGDRVIFTMPKSLLIKNYEEQLLWSNLDPSEVVIIDGTPEQRKKQIANSKAKIFLMGFTMFADSWGYMRDKYPNLSHLSVDELHLGFSTHGQRDFRNPNKYHGTKRTAMMYDYMKKGGNFLPMTGTLINGRLSSAYPFLHVIEPKYYVTYDQFLNYHALLDDYGSPIYWKNHERLQTCIDRHSVRTTFEEAYGSEQKQIFIEYCTMSKAQRRAYSEMEVKAVAELEDDQLLEAANSGVATRRCLEIMQCPEKYGLKADAVDGKDAHLTNWLLTIKDSGEALLIFEPIVESHPRLMELCNHLGITATHINGKVINDARAKADADFRSGKAQVMICSPATAGVGFNWAHVDTLIFYSLDYQDTTFIQNYRRAMRGVRETVLKIYLFFYRNSLDLHIAKKLKLKSEDRNKIEDGIHIDIMKEATEIN
jgi:hypothetical protein